MPLSWYAGDGYDGILLSESISSGMIRCATHKKFLSFIALRATEAYKTRVLEKALRKFYRPEIYGSDFYQKHRGSPIGFQKLRGGLLREYIQFQKVSTVVEPIGKAISKTTHCCDSQGISLFAKQPVVGIISGFKPNTEPNTGVRLISELATSNPHLAFFVYDSLLAEGYRNPPDNVVFFSVDDEDTRAVLPIFFQALDLVCFPAVPGTSPSLVLEAMAYGNPAVVISQYGLPPEIEGAGVLVECESAVGNDLDISVQQVSKTINQLLKNTKCRGEYKQIAKGFATRYTWEHTAEEIVRLFRQSTTRAQTRRPSSVQTLFPPIFCQHYDPRTGTTYPSAYRQETKQFEPLENALAEVLLKSHTPAEVKTVFKHFQHHERLRTRNRLNLTEF